MFSLITIYNLSLPSLSGVNKVRTYKPVSFSIIGGATSPAPTNQNTAAFRTSSSFVGSTQQNVGVGSASATAAAAATTTAASTVTLTTTSTDSKEIGNTSANSETFSSPSYSNFNGSSSVIISASSPGSAYTSITMNSRKGKNKNDQEMSDPVLMHSC